MTTPTPALIRALRILARDIQSDDGVANQVIDEAALRLEELDDHLTAAKRDLEYANGVITRAMKHIRECHSKAIQPGACQPITPEPSSPTS